MKPKRTKASKKEGIYTDIKKSISENLEDRINAWESIKKDTSCIENEISILKKQLLQIPNNAENRSRRADLRIRIEDAKERIKGMVNETDQIEYIGCIAKVVMDSYKIKQDPTRGKNIDKETHQEVRVISAMGPMRPRTKKKKMHQAKGNVVITKSMSLFAAEDDGSDGESMEECKRLAQLTHEIPVDQSDFEYCPSCPGKIIMEFVEKPPTISCPRCGLSRDDIDITSSAVHDKETPVHIPFTYRPKQHFESWINRVTGRTRYVIPDDIKAPIFIEVHNMRIEDLDLITWDVIDRILRKLAKKVSDKFNAYYQHVYQITNIIRGSAILNLSPAQKQDLLDMFDVIYESWERNKDPDRSNFMSNAFVLQMCFSILGYPDQVIGMFNMLKGSDNLKDYDRICKLICEENGWNWEKVQSSVLANAKYVGDHNILDLIPVEDDDDNPFLEDDKPFIPTPVNIVKSPAVKLPAGFIKPSVNLVKLPVGFIKSVSLVVKTEPIVHQMVGQKRTAGSICKEPALKKQGVSNINNMPVVKPVASKKSATQKGFKMGKFPPPPQRSIFDVLQHATI